MTSGVDMKNWLLLPFAVCVSLVIALVYLLDQWLGIVAYRLYYFVFCSIVALMFSTVWFVAFKKRSVLAGVIIFLVCASQFILPPSSGRLLRSAMLKVPVGTDADAIERVVREEYQGSRYALPRIYKDRAGNNMRVHVSLLSQKAGSCTSLLFIVEDGAVVRSIFSPD